MQLFLIIFALLMADWVVCHEQTLTSSNELT